MKDPHYLAIKLTAFSNTKQWEWMEYAQLGRGAMLMRMPWKPGRQLELGNWEMDKRHHLQIIFLGKPIVFSTSM